MSIAFNIIFNILKWVSLCLLIYFIYKEGGIRVIRRRGLRAFSFDYKYLWGGFIAGAVVGFGSKFSEIFGNEGVMTGTTAGMTLTSLCGIAIIALIKALTRHKPYGYWKRFLRNAGLYFTGMFAGLLLGGIAVWIVIIVIVLAIIATPGGSSSGGSSGDDKECCFYCHYFHNGTCGRTDRGIDDPHGTVCNGYQ